MLNLHSIYSQAVICANVVYTYITQGAQNAYSLATTQKGKIELFDVSPQLPQQIAEKRRQIIDVLRPVGPETIRSLYHTGELHEAIPDTIKGITPTKITFAYKFNYSDICEKIGILSDSVLEHCKSLCSNDCIISKDQQIAKCAYKAMKDPAILKCTTLFDFEVVRKEQFSEKIGKMTFRVLNQADTLIKGLDAISGLVLATFSGLTIYSATQTLRSIKGVAVAQRGIDKIAQIGKSSAWAVATFGTSAVAYNLAIDSIARGRVQ